MKKIINIENLSYQIPFSQTIIEKLCLEVHQKDFLGILGHNGSGKTTLMDLLMGFRGITQGRMTVLNEDPHSMTRTTKNKIVFLSQDVNFKGNISISQFLKFQSELYPNYSKEDEKRLMEVFELSPYSRIGSLSLGEQKKVQIIAGLSSRPELILIDEITAVLDPETREKFFRELEFARQNFSLTVILATNIAEDLVDRADKVLFIQDQKCELHSPQEILHLFNIEAAA